jgi:SAM-dependent methyltransferase
VTPRWLTHATLDGRDLVDRLRGRRDPLVPPRKMIFVGGPLFRAVGEEFFALFRRAGLRPEHDVLDVGSGIGRMAVPMVGWLRGRYEGFEVVPEGVEWCRSNITPRYPNFSFTHVDIYNGTYNPHGHLRAADFRFPYDDASFDFAFLTSVFTHLLPADLHHYLAELGRVLRPEGILLTTYFLIDEQSLAAVRNGRAELAFVHRRTDPLVGEYRTISAEEPEQAVGYPADAVAELHEEAGLPIVEQWPGGWPGRAGTTLQDVTVSRRRPAPVTPT